MGMGYQNHFQSPKSTAMGMAGTSLNLDASAVFFNPGAMSALPGRLRFAAGLHGIQSSTKFQLEQPSVYQAITDNPIVLPFYLYASASVTPRLSAGLAINEPFGTRVTWEEGWAGRFLTKQSVLQSLNIQPTFSYQLLDNLFVGAGLSILLGKTEMIRKLPVQDDNHEGELSIKGNATTWGINAGILWWPASDLRLGISYRSQMKLEFEDAQAIFKVPSLVETSFPSPNTVSTSIPLPASLDAGIAWDASERWMWVVNLNYVFWNVFENRQLDFAINSSVLVDENNPSEYSNTFSLRIGTQFHWQENLVLRAGTFYNPSPVNPNYFTPENPSLNSLGFTTGVSFMPFDGFSIDMALAVIMGIQEEVRYTPGNFNGIYKSRNIIPGLGVSYHF